MMIDPDVEVLEKEERLLLGDVDYLVIEDDTDHDQDLRSGVQPGVYLPHMVGGQGQDQDLIHLDLGLHPVVLPREVLHQPRTKNHPDTRPQLFPVPERKGQDVEIMTKKDFAFKVINASLITEMMQLC